MKNHPFFKEINKMNLKLDDLKKLILGKPECLTDKKIINNKECMELFQVSSGTLANWRRQGKIPYKQIDNKIYYRTDEIMNMLNSNNNNNNK